MIVMLSSAPIPAAYEDDSGGGTIAPSEPCYCVRRPEGNWRVTQIIDKKPVTFLIDDSKIQDAFKKCDSALVKGSDSLETQSGAHINFIDPNSILSDIRYPDNYLERGSSVTFSCDGRKYEASSSEFRAKTRPISN